jgi:hypothetical protein
VCVWRRVAAGEDMVAPPLVGPKPAPNAIQQQALQPHPSLPRLPLNCPTRNTHLRHLHAAVVGEHVASILLQVVEGAVGGLVHLGRPRLQLALG